MCASLSWISNAISKALSLDQEARSAASSDSFESMLLTRSEELDVEGVKAGHYIYRLLSWPLV